MKLYLVRHAPAGNRGDASFLDDSLRPLSSKGLVEIEAVARSALRLGVSFDVILTSPFLRALQTAQMFAKVWGVPDKLVIREELASPAQPRKVLNLIKEYFEKASGALVVGHEPDLSRLASCFLAGDESLRLEFPKSGLMRLDLQTCRFGAASLGWFAGPAILLNLYDVQPSSPIK